ncbi:nucleoside triphosphate pyrophosphohydrolase [bacterium]|nr:nucleoside triphosphate pyrophosphohydrolase [bacterium]
MSRLRGPDGCPWDKEQTHDSLKPYLLEEAYEVLEAVDRRDFDGLREELGDMLLQSVFHAQLASEAGLFNIQDVLKTLNEKLVRRHPHVFGEAVITGSDEQVRHWEKIKKSEGKKSALDGVPVTAPSLLRAHRTQQKAAAVGFDWPEASPVWDKIREELDELKEAVSAGKQDAVEEELGDLLFAVVNLSRFLHVHPEDALRRSVDKFRRRFRAVEAEMESAGRDMRKTPLAELDAVWDRIKREEHHLTKDDPCV